MNRDFDSRSANSSVIGWGSAEVFYVVKINQVVDAVLFDENK